MSPRIPICAAIASLSLSACMSPSANLPRDALVDTTSAAGLVMNDTPTAQPPDGVSDRVAKPGQG